MVYLVVFISGLLFGSFANVCIYRIPLRQSILVPSSHCPQCRKKIAWFDNIPLLSYVLLSGRCRHCGGEISWQYPLIEVLTGVLFVPVYAKFGFHFVSAIFLLFTLLLVIASGIDARLRIIPDKISFSLMAAGVLFSPFNSFLAMSVPLLSPGMIANAVFSLSSILLSAGILYLIAVLGEKIFKKEAMGGGDIKLIAGIGAFTGIINVLWVIMLASLLGGAVGSILLLCGKKKRFETIPFGPYLCIASLVVVLAQPHLDEWYGSLFR